MRLRFLAVPAAMALGCSDSNPPVGFDAGFHVDAGDFDAGDTESCTARKPGDPGVVLGTGEVDWEELADGDPVPFYHGPQDGYHLYGAVKERSIDLSSAAIVAFAAFDAGEQINSGLGVYARPPAWFSVGDGWRATFGYFVVMYVEEPQEVDGHTLCVIVRVTDAAGAEFVDERTITLYFDGDM